MNFSKSLKLLESKTSLRALDNHYPLCIVVKHYYKGKPTAYVSYNTRDKEFEFIIQTK